MALEQSFQHLTAMPGATSNRCCRPELMVAGTMRRAEVHSHRSSLLTADAVPDDLQVPDSRVLDLREPLRWPEMPASPKTRVLPNPLRLSTPVAYRAAADVEGCELASRVLLVVMHSFPDESRKPDSAL